MAYTSEIEKLEKRWAENPKGRNFAPLADAYRKAGELDRAIELCKAGLERHPDYVSAHIVFGRCMIDQKNEAAASDVFRKVLTLDPENVLGLKMLADIAERGKRYDEAVEWLSRLLSADPMNGDAAEALARAKGKAALAGQAVQAVATQPTAPVRAVSAAPPARPPRPAPPTPPAPPAAAARPAPRATPAPSARPAPPPPSRPAPPAPPRATPEPVVRLVPEEKTAPMAKPDLLVEHVSERPSAPDIAAAGTPQDIETFDGTIDIDAAAHGAARADGIEVQEEVVLEPRAMEVEGLAHTQYESGMFAPPPQAAEPQEDLPTIDLPLIMPDDLVEPPPPPVAAAPAAAPPPAVRLADDDGAADTATLSRAEPVLTETMAELYLRQGHQEDALRVYQALLTQRPGDARLRARVQALSPGGMGRGRTGESLPSFLKRILAGRLPAAAPDPIAPAPTLPPLPPSDPTPEVGGGSPLAGAFASLGLEAEPEFTAPGEATRPAADSISLDAVFGEAAPPPPAAPSVAATASPPAPSSPLQPPPSPSQTGGFSFDQFFSAAAAPPAPPAPAPVAPPAPPPRPSGRTSGPRPAAPGEDEGDLDQFQAWLRGLKS